MFLTDPIYRNRHARPADDLTEILFYFCGWIGPELQKKDKGRMTLKETKISIETPHFLSTRQQP